MSEVLSSDSPIEKSERVLSVADNVPFLMKKGHLEDTPYDEVLFENPLGALSRSLCGGRV